MENTNSTERCIDLLYSPCSLFEQLVKAFYKCLGGGHDHDHDHHHEQVDTKSPSDQVHQGEREMKFTVTRRPSRPKISSGKGGQIN